ncbi:hypothetical protein Tco_0083486 [Tanacetum coccineum]
MLKVATEVVGYCRGQSDRSQAVMKAATKVVGCNRGYWLLRRLPHRLQAIAKAATLLRRAALLLGKVAINAKGLPRKAVVKATTKIAGSYEVCHTTKKATLKATIELVGSCRGCYINYRLLLLQRLNDAVKVAAEVVGCCRGCHIAKNAAMLLKRLERHLEGINVAKKAIHMLLPCELDKGCFKGLIVMGPTDGGTDCANRGTYQAPMVIGEIICIELEERYSWLKLGNTSVMASPIIVSSLKASLITRRMLPNTSLILELFYDELKKLITHFIPMISLQLPI